MSMGGVMKVGLWLTALLLMVELSQEWGGVVEPRQECGIKKKFFCPAGFYCNLDGSGCIPKDESSYSKPVTTNTKNSDFLHNTSKIVTRNNSNNKPVSFLNNNNGNLLNNNISAKNGKPERLLNINNGKPVTNLNVTKRVSLLGNNANNGKPVSKHMLNSITNIASNLVNIVTEMNSNSTNDEDENEAIEDGMGSLTAPSQGPLPVIIGGAVAGCAAVALAAYLTCGRKTPTGYQNI